MFRRMILVVFLMTMLCSGCGNADEVDSSVQVPQRTDVSEEITVSTEDIQNFTENSDTVLFEADCGNEEYHSLMKFIPHEHIEYSAADHSLLLYENYYSIDFHSDREEVEQWIGSVISQIEDSYAEVSDYLVHYAEEESRPESTEEFYPYSNYLNMGAARHDSKILSLLSVSSVYSGGPHPSNIQTAYNFDFDQMEIMKLEDVIYPKRAEDLLSILLSALETKLEQLGGYGFYDNYKTIVHEMMEYGKMVPDWYFNHSGLVIYFNPYEIAPYAAGIINITLPYEKLHGILREEYYPQYMEEYNGIPYIKGTSESLNCISLPITDGEHTLLGFTETVYECTISEITWLNGKAIAKDMLLSANQLHSKDVIDIIGGIEDDSRSFAVEYQTEHGKRKVGYIHQDSVTDKP